MYQQNEVDRDVDLKSSSVSDSKLDRLNIPEQLQTNSITNAVEVKTSIEVMMGRIHDSRLLETTIDLSVELYFRPSIYLLILVLL